MWSVAILCGSIIAACSGTIETPTEEFPPRQGGSRTAAVTADDDNDAPPRAPAARDDEDDAPPAASADPDDEVPAAPAEDEEPPAAPAEDEEPPPAASGDLSFASDIQPIFSAGCAPCHTTSGIVHNIGSDDLAEALEDALTFEEEVIFEIEAGEMPPDCDGAPPGSGGSCISEEDFQAIQDWYAAGAPE